MVRSASEAFSGAGSGSGASDLARALDERELVISRLHRGTLHLVRSEDYPWLHALTTPQLATSNQTRLRQEGVSPEQADRGVEVVRTQLAEAGGFAPQTTMSFAAS